MTETRNIKVQIGSDSRRVVMGQGQVNVKMEGYVNPNDFLTLNSLSDFATDQEVADATENMATTDWVGQQISGTDLVVGFEGTLT